MVNAGFTKLTGYSKDEFIALKGAHIRESSNNSNIVELT